MIQFETANTRNYIYIDPAEVCCVRALTWWEKFIRIPVDMSAIEQTNGRVHYVYGDPCLVSARITRELRDEASEPVAVEIISFPDGEVEVEYEDEGNSPEVVFTLDARALPPMVLKDRVVETEVELEHRQED